MGIKDLSFNNCKQDDKVMQGSEEKIYSENYLIKMSQQEVFKEELYSIGKEKGNPQQQQVDKFES